MTHGGYPPGVGMDDTGTDSEGDHQHKKHNLDGDTVEGGGGADKHLTPRQPTDSRRPPRVQGQKRDGYGYNGVKALPRAC